MDRFDLATLTGKKLVDIRGDGFTQYLEFTFDDGSVITVAREDVFDKEGNRVDTSNVPDGKLT